MKHTNRLIEESSPYLLQHAHNPVNWYAWNKDTLNMAKTEHKLMLISVGYSACHWCHVMEHESFEDEEIAALMNQYFISVKVDREERPDIDMVYMGAVQLMTGHGGWPLNCFALPDGRPIYGGTYFPKSQWKNVLRHLADLFQHHPEKVLEYATNLTKGLKHLEIPKAESESTFSMDRLRACVHRWQQTFDNEHGGPQRAPKFPLPNNYLFLLHYSNYENDLLIKKHVDLTLTKMAWGGIYDHIGGGFARYSTDVLWKVPHFEKMLYDNAQLVSLYTQAYKQQPLPLYKQVVYETIAFVKRELMAPSGGFYSALDADSEGVEGKYYVWQKEEMQGILDSDFTVFADYYGIHETGYWEDGNYILMRSEDEAIVALKHQMSVEELATKIHLCKTRLFNEREKRSKPALDHKILASWNGLMCKALTEAYLVFEDESFKALALANALFLKEQHCLSRGQILRINHLNTSISGFLDDYVFVADAFMQVYLITADELWLLSARALSDYAITHFYSEKERTCFYTDSSQEKLVVRTSEWNDNVIPASSSQMAINLKKLSVYFDEVSYAKIADVLLSSVMKELEHYGQGYSNWAILLLSYYIAPPTEVAIVGNAVHEKLIPLYQQTSSNVIFALSSNTSDLPLVKERYVEGKTTIYVCRHKACLLPTESITEALIAIGENTV